MNKLTKLIIMAALVGLGACAPSFAGQLYNEDGERVSQKAEYDWTVKQLFKENDRVFDFAIGSAIETGFAWDSRTNGGWGYAVQTPILFVADVISADIGYLAPFGDSGRGTTTIGGMLRLDRVFSKYWKKESGQISGYFPESPWIPKAVFGPFIDYSITDDDFMAGVKIMASWGF